MTIFDANLYQETIKYRAGKNDKLKRNSTEFARGSNIKFTWGT